MNRSTVIRFRLLLPIAALTLSLLPAPVYALTQQDWMVALVDGLGRSFGLPDTPAPQDYINILSGNRKLRIEAEVASSPDDSVSKMALPNFGVYSGDGWLLGISRPTDVHLNFVVPIDGRYRFAATLRSPGHRFQVAGQTFQVDGNADKFSTVDIGDVAIPAGPTTIIDTLPPGGALDAVTLTAPDLAPIFPGKGWQPDAPLTWEVLALTTVQALNLAAELPRQAAPVQSLEAEDIGDIEGARLVEDTHLGAPSAGRWLRTSVQSAILKYPVSIPEGGFYDLILTAMGSPITVNFNDHFELTASGKPYLEELPLPPVYLPPGETRLTISLPPRSGLDRIQIRPRLTNLTTLSEILQLPVITKEPEPSDLDQLSERLATAPR